MQNNSSIVIKGAILVIDIQNDFCPGGSLAVPKGDTIVPIVNSVVKKFQIAVFTQDYHPAGHISFASSYNKKPFEKINLFYGEQVLWPDHCVQGTKGAGFHPDLNIVSGNLIIRKGYHKDIDSYSAFFENDRKTRTGLEGYLKELSVKRIFMCGLATDFCVFYSAIDARGLGFEVFLIEDACCGIDIDGSLKSSINQMIKKGVQIIQSKDLNR